MENGYMDVEIDRLRPHPQNEIIYGKDEDVSDLKDQIKSIGKILDELKITEEYVIISGHRRWKAAKELGFKTVPCRFIGFESQEEELASLIMFNSDRIKTYVQMTREGILLCEALSEAADKRKEANLMQNRSEGEDSSTSEIIGEHSTLKALDAGRTRDIAAKAAGFSSGRVFDYARKALAKADELKREGREYDSKMFLAVLNRAPTAANDLLSIELDKLSEDDKEKIISGKSPRSFLPTSEQNKKTVALHKILSKEIKAIEKSVEILKESISRSKELEKAQVVEYRKQIFAQINALEKIVGDMQASFGKMGSDLILRPVN